MLYYGLVEQSARSELHALVDRLPGSQVPEAARYLQYLSADPVLLSLLAAPPDDEPYTPDQRRADEDAEASILAGEGVSHEAILAEFAL